MQQPPEPTWSALSSALSSVRASCDGAAEERGGAAAAPAAARCRHCRGLLSVEDEEAHLRATEERLSSCHWYYPRLTRHEAKALLQRMDVGSFLLRDSSDARYVYALSLKTPRGVMSIRITYDRGQFVFDCAERRAADSLMRFECALDLVQFYACQSGASAPSSSEQPRSRHRQQHHSSSPPPPSPHPSAAAPPAPHHHQHHHHRHHCHNHREQPLPPPPQQQQQKKWTFFVDKSGKNMPMVLSRPALRSLPSLTHLCRLRINCQLAQAATASRGGVQQLPLPPALKAYLASYPNCV